MAIPSFPTINNPNIRSALAEAAEQESGTILNDHYSPEFYTDRRAKFLGRQAGYAHFRNGLFEIAGFDADAVYGENGEDLSVQEVRRREIVHEVVPFLPLPTTGNTDSMNSFAGLPDSEWAEGKAGVYRMLKPTPSPPPSPARLMGANATECRQRKQQTEDETVYPAQGAKRDSGVSFTTAMSDSEVGDAAQQLPAVKGSEHLPNILARLGQLHPDSSNGNDVEAADPPATASASNGSEIGQLGTPAVATTSRGTKRTATGQIVRPAPAYQSSGNRQPIKYPKGTRPPLLGPNETSESVEADSEAGTDSARSGEESAAPPRKRVKINVGPPPVRSKKKAPRAAVAREETEGIEELAPRKPSSLKRKTTAISTSTANSASSGPSIDAIVCGAALPRTRGQAQIADDARYAQLLARAKANFRARKKKPPAEPDIMPEYFNVANFPAGQEKDSVRCVCGVLQDDGEPMVCCDEQGCSVWQHVHCVEEAAPGDLDGGAYRCHNCDPWAHRRVIQRLRRGEVVG